MKVMQKVAWWNRKTLPKVWRIACFLSCILHEEVACNAQGRLVSQETKDNIEAKKNAQSSPTLETSFQVPPNLDNVGIHHNSQLEEEPLLSLSESEEHPSSERQSSTVCCSKVSCRNGVHVLFIFYLACICVSGKSCEFAGKDVERSVSSFYGRHVEDHTTTDIHLV